MRASLPVLLACLVAAALAPAASAAPPTTAAERQALVDAIVSPWVDAEVVVGASIGVLADGEASTMHYGRRRLGDDAPPDDATIYEIGSVSKVFTATLLADLVVDHTVALGDRVVDVLPGVTAPRDGAAITLLDLVTHHSGLPPFPLHLLLRGGLGNEFPDYDAARMRVDLGELTLLHPPGSAFAYSNFGAALLGVALAERAGSDYEALIRERIAAPLGMVDTGITLSPEQAGRAAIGHAAGVATGAANIGAFAPAGEIRSTVVDLLRFVRAGIEPGPESIRLALWDTHVGRRDVDDKGAKIGLGWMIDERGLRWHNGQIGGFHSFVAVDLEGERAVVILANSGDSVIDELGAALMKAIAGEAHEAPTPALIELPAGALAPYVGAYRRGDQPPARVTREAHRLYVEIPGLPRVRLHAIGEHRFKDRLFGATVAFRGLDGGTARELVIEGVLFPDVYTRIDR